MGGGGFKKQKYIMNCLKWETKKGKQSTIIDVYNVPLYVVCCFQLKTHKTMESVYKYVSKSCLTEEYFPDDYKGTPIGDINTVKGILLLRWRKRLELHVNK